MGSHLEPVGYVSVGRQEEESRVGTSGILATRRYHPGVCHTCLAAPPDSVQQPLTPPLLRCAQCQLVVYCSKKCQKNDWPKHRELCRCNKVLRGKNVFGRAMEAVGSGQSWTNFRNNVSLAASVNMKRALLPYERDMFSFPCVCEVCKCAHQPSLACCPRCHSVFYCSSEHMEKDSVRHKQFCNHYLLLLQCDMVEAVNGIQDLPVPVEVDNVYTNLPDKLMTILKRQLEVDTTLSPLNPKTVTTITERLSYPLSLLYAIQNIGLGSNNTGLHEIEEIRVHVVGAVSITELLGIIRWEYFVHRLPALKKFHIVFVGPELFTDASDIDDSVPEDHILDDSGMTMCEDCCKRDRRIVYEMYGKCYHEFVSSTHYSVPDVIIAYNCGLHENSGQAADKWSNSLPLLVQHQHVPFVFTSYTAQEAKLDLAVLERSAPVKVLMEPHLNPFHSLRPYRDFEIINEESPIYFWNQYITCVRGNKSDLTVDKC